MKKSLIVAATENNVIGKDNGLIWHLPEDLKFFKKMTMGHHVIMGRKTFESFPGALPGRENLIITRNENWKGEDGVMRFSSLNDALKHAEEKGDDEAFIAGGGQVYREGLEIADNIYLTRIHAEMEGDTFFPEINEEQWKVVWQEKKLKDEKHKYSFDFYKFVRRK